MLHDHHYTVEQANSIRGWVAERVQRIRRVQSELDAVDIVLRDVDRGLVDFPALRDGEEVYLCWLIEEDEISFWHEPNAGFAGREPL